MIHVDIYNIVNYLQESWKYIIKRIYLGDNLSSNNLIVKKQKY